MRKSRFKNICGSAAKIVATALKKPEFNFKQGDYIEYMPEKDIRDPGRISLKEPARVKQQGIITYIHPEKLWILVNRGYGLNVYIPDTICRQDFKYIKLMYSKEKTKSKRYSNSV